MLQNTIVWTVFVGFMTGSQDISDFSECFSHKSNLEKNKIDCTNGQSRRDEMSIETAYLPSPKPRRGDTYRLKIVQTLVQNTELSSIQTEV
ncbi:hypothetical protein C6499_03900 [Candidatus Poribacteria bacterium]|nr:MAG: hypothetical protein C6499_03900 [Candidatus Poribacteria bacterium]